MSEAISSFHTKAVAEAQAKTERAKTERERASRFLRQLDDVLSEGFNEVVEPV
jgi:hypothetical protein